MSAVRPRPTPGSARPGHRRNHRGCSRCRLPLLSSLFDAEVEALVGKDHESQQCDPYGTIVQADFPRWKVAILMMLRTPGPMCSGGTCFPSSDRAHAGADGRARERGRWNCRSSRLRAAPERRPVRLRPTVHRGRCVAGCAACLRTEAVPRGPRRGCPSRCRLHAGLAGQPKNSLGRSAATSSSRSPRRTADSSAMQLGQRLHECWVGDAQLKVEPPRHYATYCFGILDSCCKGRACQAWCVARDQA